MEYRRVVALAPVPPFMTEELQFVKLTPGQEAVLSSTMAAILVRAGVAGYATGPTE